jgi:hypothetical protein
MGTSQQYQQIKLFRDCQPLQRRSRRTGQAQTTTVPLSAHTNTKVRLSIDILIICIHFNDMFNLTVLLRTFIQLIQDLYNINMGPLDNLNHSCGTAYREVQSTTSRMVGSSITSS